MAKRLIFLLGGARSGKSHYARNLGAAARRARALRGHRRSRKTPICSGRIADHRTTRARPIGIPWKRREHNCPRDRRLPLTTHDTLLLDCLTLLTSNLLLELPEAASSATRRMRPALSEIERLLEVV